MSVSALLALALFRGWWNLLAFPASFRKADCNRLLRIGHLFAASAALQLALFHFMHFALNVIARAWAVFAAAALFGRFF